ncbi:MAG: hypothetical protein FWE23_08420 [Chitinivibrionia bacterium]|nr:hypothetical protein [Chitinivibrionia bacterium]
MNIKSIINVPLLIIAVIVGIIGYIFLSIAPIDSVFSWTIAPIVLVVFYLVLIPLAIIKRPKNEKSGD